MSEWKLLPPKVPAGSVVAPVAGAPEPAAMVPAVVPVPDPPAVIEAPAAVPAVPDDPRISCAWVYPGGDRPEPKAKNPLAASQAKARRENDDLEAAARAFRAMGYRIVENRPEWGNSTYVGMLRGFLAVGRAESPEGADALWLFSNRTMDDWSRLDVFEHGIPASCFRGRDLRADDDRDGFILSYEETDMDGKPYPDGGTKFQMLAPSDLRLSADEPDSALLEKLPLLPYDLEELAGMMEAAGSSLDAFVSMLEMRRAAEGEDDDLAALVPQVVEALLPAGEVVVMVGETEAGKSTLAHQFAAAVTSGAAEVLGYSVVPMAGDARPSAVFLAGEESTVSIRARGRRFGSGGLTQGLVVVVEREGRTIGDALARIEAMPGLRLVVVDPAGTWIGEGDEDKAGAVSAFLAALMDFARRKRCCVLVLHHVRKLSKRGQRTRLVDLRTLVRGSGVWIERPRVVLGLVKNPDGSRSLGVIKSNLAPMIPQHEIRLGGDPDTSLSHRLDSTPPTRARTAPQAPAPVGPPGDDATAVAGVVATLRAAGQVVRRSGDRGLFKLAPPDLVGWSRDRVGDALAAAIAAGLLVDDRRNGITPVNHPANREA